MGRIPVWVGDDCLPPFENKIDWNYCSIRIAESDVPKTGEILRHFLQTHTDQEIIEMGMYGHDMWDRYLNDDHWEGIWAEVVTERLRELK